MIDHPLTDFEKFQMILGGGTLLILFLAILNEFIARRRRGKRTR